MRRSCIIKDWCRECFPIDVVEDCSNGDIVKYNEEIHGDLEMIGHTFRGDNFAAQVEKIY